MIGIVSDCQGLGKGIESEKESRREWEYHWLLKGKNKVGGTWRDLETRAT